LTNTTILVNNTTVIVII